MFWSEYHASPQEVRSFAALQVVVTAGFVAVLFFVLGGLQAPRPPWPAVVGLLIAVGLATVFAERVWRSTPILNPNDALEDLHERAVAIFAGQTVRRLAICQIPIILSVIVTFLAPWGGWPLLIAAVPGIVVLAWEITPNLRNTSLTEAMLDTDGATSGLVDAFRNR